MKSQFTLKKALLTLLFVVIGATVFAQGTGKISGTVADKKTGETIIGASVKLLGVNQAVATDVEGRYIIGGLMPGNYVLEVSYIGYTIKSITAIEVKDGNTTSVNVTLEESQSQTLNQVVVIRIPK